MRMITNKSYAMFLFLFGIASAIAGTVPASGPPAPTGKTNATLPPPPGAPIDDYLFVLVVLGVIFAFYTIYKHQIKTKPII